jgi:RND family efflux transporter MFP subunit
MIIVLVVLTGIGVLAASRFLGPRAVPTVSVVRGRVVRAFYATGVVRPDFEYTIKSRAQGALVELNVREGQKVAAGQVLARVDDKQLRFEVAKAQAELQEAQAQARDDAPQRLELLARLQEARTQAEISDREMTRVQSAFDKGVGSMGDLDASRRSHVQWVQATAALEGQLGTWKIESTRRADVAAANLRKAQADLGDTEVRAPIAGLVLERYVEANEVVSINEQLLLVADPADKLMKAAVDEEDIARTYIGQKVWMQLYAFGSPDPNEPPRLLEGRVQEILPTANPANKTYEVKVAFVAPPPELRVGMTAELNFIDAPPAADTHTALVVPATAVMDGNVYRAEGARYVAVPVKVGVKALDKFEVAGDLQEGDQVVVDAKQVAPIKLPQAAKASVPTRIGDK